MGEGRLRLMGRAPLLLRTNFHWRLVPDKLLCEGGSTTKDVSLSFIPTFLFVEFLKPRLSSSHSREGLHQQGIFLCLFIMWKHVESQVFPLRNNIFQSTSRNTNLPSLFTWDFPPGAPSEAGSEDCNKGKDLFSCDFVCRTLFPSEVHLVPSVTSFWCQVTTYVFSQAFDTLGWFCSLLIACFCCWSLLNHPLHLPSLLLLKARKPPRTARQVVQKSN